MVAALGTTTLSILLFSFVVPVVIFVITVAVDWREQRRAGATVNAIIKGSFLSWQTIIPSTVYLVAWASLLGWSLSNTAYKDHVALLGRVHTLTNQNKTLQSANDVLKSENQQLKLVPAKTITRTLPPPELAKRCWLSNHFGIPNSTIKGAVTASAAIIHCNYRVDAPYLVQVEFDRDFIPGAGIPLDSGVTMVGGGGKRGRIYTEQISSPALLSDQVFIVTVYGETDQYPRALRASIQAMK